MLCSFHNSTIHYTEAFFPAHFSQKSANTLILSLLYILVRTIPPHVLLPAAYAAVPARDDLAGNPCTFALCGVEEVKKAAALTTSHFLPLACLVPLPNAPISFAYSRNRLRFSLSGEK